MKIGENIRFCRSKRFKTMEQVARATGCAVNSIWSYERDVVNPSIQACIKIADYLNVSLDELVGRVPPE